MDTKEAVMKKTTIDGVFTIHSDAFKDERGIISVIYKSFEFDAFSEYVSREVTHTRSYPNVIRGLHAQAWNRVVYPVNGKILNVLVDTREDSKTFGKIEKLIIDDSNRYAIYVPTYVANGYAILGTENVDYLYFLDYQYDKKYTKGILWNDPDLSIDWLVKQPIISEKDKGNKTMRELFPKKYD